MIVAGCERTTQPELDVNYQDNSNQMSNNSNKEDNHAF